MKNHFRYPILITLAIIMTVALMNAQAATPIGATPQPNPYETIPTAETFFMVGGPTLQDKAQMKDGDLSTSGSIPLGAPHILRPDGNGFHTAWSESPAVGFAAWDEETHDSDGKYVFSPAGATTGLSESSTLQDTPVGSSGTISSVRVTIVARRAATATAAERDNINIVMRLGATDLLSGNLLSTASDLTTYATYTFSSVTKPGGGAWGWADVDGLQAGVRYVRAGTASTQIRVTQLFIEVIGPTAAFFEFNTFAATPVFPITFVDLKMKYSVPTLTDDTYSIEFSIDGVTWVSLQAATTSQFDDKTGLPAVRPWAQVARPGGGSWGWADISSLRVRISVTQVGGAWDGAAMIVFEVWATVYATPIPPSASTGLSIQPQTVSAGVGQQFFVDIYVQNVTDMYSYEYLIDFDNTTLSADEAFTYYPWITQVVNDPNNTLSRIYIVFTMTSPVPIGTGFTGNSPITRIYFTVLAAGGGSTPLIFRKGAAQTFIADTTGTPIPIGIHDGVVLLPMFLSLQPPGVLPPGDPRGTQWHELWPRYSHIWNLTSWEDNFDGVLSPSDQIDMLNETGWRYWFHVDQVTTTIYWTLKLPDEGTGIAEPQFPMPPDPTAPQSAYPGDPIGTIWHMIYPTYSRMINITSWTDNTDGNFTVSDQFDFEFLDDPGRTYWAHLDKVSTDIIISQKGEPEPPPPPVPEFPLGLGLIMTAALAIPVTYLWRTRKHVRRG